MSYGKLNDLQQDVKKFSHYYSTFLIDPSCRAVKSQKLLKEIAKLTKELEKDIKQRLKDT